MCLLHRNLSGVSRVRTLRATAFRLFVEISEERDFALKGNLKYAHSDAYLRRLAKEHGLVVEMIEPQVIRQDGGIDVVGFLAVLRRSQQ